MKKTLSVLTGVLLRWEGNGEGLLLLLRHRRHHAHQLCFLFGPLCAVVGHFGLELLQDQNEVSVELLVKKLSSDSFLKIFCRFKTLVLIEFFFESH